MPKLDIIIVAGVSGCGKSTVAKALAETCGYPFLEGDEYHPAENVAAMAAGRPLTDEMRWPWLRRLASSAVEKANGAGGAVVSCSALKRAYRDLLREQTGGCRFVLLTGDRDMIYARMSPVRTTICHPLCSTASLPLSKVRTPRKQTSSRSP